MRTLLPRLAGQNFMRFEKTELAEVVVVEPTPLPDERGFFARTFCEREFAEAGLEHRFVQHSQSCSLRKGTLRGMHFQDEPDREVKLVSCIRGAIYDVAVDMRPHSSTYGRWLSVELTDANRRQLYIPEGFAHGFMTLCDDVVVSYLISAFYAPALARGVRYDDPTIGIKWPGPVTAVSERDLSWPYLEASPSRTPMPVGRAL